MEIEEFMKRVNLGDIERIILMDKNNRKFLVYIDLHRLSIDLKEEALIVDGNVFFIKNINNVSVIDGGVVYLTIGEENNENVENKA